MRQLELHIPATELVALECPENLPQCSTYRSRRTPKRRQPSRAAFKIKELGQTENVLSVSSPRWMLIIGYWMSSKYATRSLALTLDAVPKTGLVSTGYIPPHLYLWICRSVKHGELLLSWLADCRLQGGLLNYSCWR
jgi:hypothetical protein